jgi:hypothetical protein
MFDVVSQLLIYQRVRLCANLSWFDLDFMRNNFRSCLQPPFTVPHAEIV